MSTTFLDERQIARIVLGMATVMPIAHALRPVHFAIFQLLQRTLNCGGFIAGGFVAHNFSWKSGHSDVDLYFGVRLNIQSEVINNLKTAIHRLVSTRICC